MTDPRLYCTHRLHAGAEVTLDPAQSHYLLRVLRLKRNDRLRLFNESCGEWRGRLVETGRGAARVRIEGLLRAPVPEPGPVLYVAPPRRGRLAWLVEKAVELGVASIRPVQTRRSVALPHNPERLTRIAVEAAEQCGRLSVPEITPLAPLFQRLGDDRPERLILADPEAGAGGLLQELRHNPAPAFLVGPEGGFAPEERAALIRRPGVRAVRLGPRVLRVETAAVALLACWALLREESHAAAP